MKLSEAIKVVERGGKVGRQGSQNYWFMGYGKKLVDAKGKAMMPLVDDKWEMFKGEIEGEKWKPVKCEDYDVNAKVSNFGRIKEEDEFCIINRGTGYCDDIYVNLLYGLVRDRLCNFVARAFVENIEGKKYVKHKDGNIYNNNAENLEWAEKEEKEKIDSFKRERKLKLSEAVRLLEKGERVKRIEEKDNYYSMKDGKIVDVNGKEIELIDDSGWEKYIGDMKKEVWKKIKENEDYEVSNYGRVRFNKLDKKFLIEERSWGRHGLCASIYNKKDGRFNSYWIHWLVGDAFLKDKSKKCGVIIHKDGNMRNNCVDNLEWRIKK